MLTIASGRRAGPTGTGPRPGRRYRRRFDPPSPPRRLLLSPLVAAYRGAGARLGLCLCEEGTFFPGLPADRTGRDEGCGR